MRHLASPASRSPFHASRRAYGAASDDPCGNRHAAARAGVCVGRYLAGLAGPLRRSTPSRVHGKSRVRRGNARSANATRFPGFAHRQIDCRGTTVGKDEKNKTCPLLPHEK